MKAVRGARVAVWILATAIAIWQHFDLDSRLMRIDESSTYRQSTIAQLGIVTVVTILIAAMALDRILELVERQLTENS
jgi:hypothetical protein